MFKQQSQILTNMAKTPDKINPLQNAGPEGGAGYHAGGGLPLAPPPRGGEGWARGTARGRGGRAFQGVGPLGLTPVLSEIRPRPGPAGGVMGNQEEGPRGADVLQEEQDWTGRPGAPGAHGAETGAPQPQPRPG